METSPFDRANGSSSARCGKQAARTPHKSEKCNVGRSSIGTGCRLSLLGCGYPSCWKPRRIRGSWVPTFVDSSPSYIYGYIYMDIYIWKVLAEGRRVCLTPHAHSSAGTCDLLPAGLCNSLAFAVWCLTGSPWHLRNVLCRIDHPTPPVLALVTCTSSSRSGFASSWDSLT